MASKLKPKMAKYRSNPVFEPVLTRITTKNRHPASSISSFKESTELSTIVYDNQKMSVIAEKNQAIKALQAKNEAWQSQNLLLQQKITTLQSELQNRVEEFVVKNLRKDEALYELEQKLNYQLSALESRLAAATAENIQLRQENSLLRQKISLKVKVNNKAASELTPVIARTITVKRTGTAFGNEAPVAVEAPKVRLSSVSNVQLRKIQKDQEAIE